MQCIFLLFERLGVSYSEAGDEKGQIGLNGCRDTPTRLENRKHLVSNTLSLFKANSETLGD